MKHMGGGAAQYFFSAVSVAIVVCAGASLNFKFRPHRICICGMWPVNFDPFIDTPRGV